MKRVVAAGFAMGLSMAFAAGIFFGHKGATKPRGCERLARLSLPDAKITMAQRLAPGSFTPMTPLALWMANDASLYKALPAFCRVAIEARPSADSDIKIEVWLPDSGWNRKFQGRGNGGFAGEI